MAECNECFHYDVCTKIVGKDKIDRVSWMCNFPDQCSEFKSTIPKTQADRIRAMSDEELADWISRSQIENIASVLKLARIPWEPHPDLQELNAKDCLEWLKQPAEEVTGE